MKSRDVKSEILETASRLFYKQGYNNTGINQIIEESGIARASLYNHFKSKTDLLHTYLENQHENWFLELEKFIKKEKTPKAKVLSIFEYRLQRQIKNEFGGCPFIKLSDEIEYDDIIFNLINKNKMQLRDLILTLLNEIQIKNSILENEELADVIYLLMEGSTITSHFQQSKEMMEKAKLIAEKLL